MKPSKSQFEQMNPNALHTAAQSIGVLVDKFSAAGGEVESAQKTIAENFIGKAGDAEHEAASRKIADLHRDADALKGVQTTLNSAGDHLVSATNNLKTTIQQVERQGFAIGNDWSLNLKVTGRTSMLSLFKAQEAAKELADNVNAWDEADHSSSQAIKKALAHIHSKAHKAPPRYTTLPYRVEKITEPQPKPGDKDGQKPGDSDSHMPGANGKPGDPGYVVPKANGDKAEYPSERGWKSDVPGADNPPGYPPVGPGAQRDQNWKNYLKGKKADGSMRPAGEIPAAYPKPESVGDKGLKIVGAAARQQGIRYVWGGGNPHGTTQGTSGDYLSTQRRDSEHKGFDCSGLSEYSIYQVTGIDPGHNSETQLDNQHAGGAHSYGHVVAGPNARSVDESKLQPGDVVYYGNQGGQHVAIYVGDGVTVETNTSGTPVHFQNRGPGLKDGSNPISVVRPNS